MVMYLHPIMHVVFQRRHSSHITQNNLFNIKPCQYLLSVCATESSCHNQTILASYKTSKVLKCNQNGKKYVYILATDNLKF